MRSTARIIGRSAFVLALPLLYLYLRRGERTRVVLRCGEKVLVLKGWLGSGQWMLPGGGMHAGEQPALAAQRELREETGIEIDAALLAYRGRHQAREKSGLRFTYHLFVGEVPECLPLKLQWHEISDGAWLNIDEVMLGKQATDTTRRILGDLE